jgi:hypothetical protein
MSRLQGVLTSLPTTLEEDQALLKVRCLLGCSVWAEIGSALQCHVPPLHPILHAALPWPRQELPDGDEHWRERTILHYRVLRKQAITERIAALSNAPLQKAPQGTAAVQGVAAAVQGGKGLRLL